MNLRAIRLRRRFPSEAPSLPEYVLRIQTALRDLGTELEQSAVSFDSFLLLHHGQRHDDSERCAECEDCQGEDEVGFRHPALALWQKQSPVQ